MTRVLSERKFTEFRPIEDQLRESKKRSSPLVIDAGPFTCYLDSDNSSHPDNYAIPVSEMVRFEPSEIESLAAVFAAHARRPRLEFIEACHPDLEAVLHAQAFVTENRFVLMICTPETLQLPEQIPGLTLHTLPENGSLEAYRTFRTIERRSFGPADSPAATDREARDHRRKHGAMIKVIARLDDAPVAVGTLTFPYRGTTEAAGIATLPDYRRRGIAAAVTARLAGLAFETGLDSVFLTAVDESAGRVYARAGFTMTGTRQINISRSENGSSSG